MTTTEVTVEECNTARHGTVMRNFIQLMHVPKIIAFWLATHGDARLLTN